MLLQNIDFKLNEPQSQSFLIEICLKRPTVFLNTWEIPRGFPKQQKRRQTQAGLHLISCCLGGPNNKTQHCNTQQ